MAHSSIFFLKDGIVRKTPIENWINWHRYLAFHSLVLVLVLILVGRCLEAFHWYKFSTVKCESCHSEWPRTARSRYSRVGTAWKTIQPLVGWYHDGLPSAQGVYATFSHLFGPGFVDMINNCCDTCFLPPSQRRGLITLACKDADNAQLLAVKIKIVAKIFIQATKRVATNYSLQHV